MEDMRDMVHSADMLELMDMLGIVDMIDLVAMMDMLDIVISLKLRFAHKKIDRIKKSMFFYFFMHEFW